MNPKTVKVQTFEKFPYKLIEWKLHDKCNYDCPFCGDINKKGYVGWQDLDTNKAIVDSIADACKGEPFWIQITGGEPTLYPKFIELLKYMKEKGAYTSLITNGSRTVRWYTDLRDSGALDIFNITFHSNEKADYKHLAEISNLFLNETTVVVNVATYTVESIPYLLEGLEYLVENTGNIITTNAMDFVTWRIDETIVGQEIFDKLVKTYGYQFGKLYKEKKKTLIPRELLPQTTTSTVTYEDGTTEIKDINEMMKLGENKFEGWDCYAGIDSMNIEPGFKFRGGCKRDKTSYEPNKLTFFDKPFKCDVDDCYCGMDMITTKIRNKV